MLAFESPSNVGDSIDRQKLTTILENCPSTLINSTIFQIAHYSCEHANQDAKTVFECQRVQNILLSNFHKIVELKTSFKGEHPLNCVCEKETSRGCRAANFLRLDFVDCSKSKLRSIKKCKPFVDEAVSKMKAIEKHEPSDKTKASKIQNYLKTNYSFRVCCFDW